MVKKYCDFIDEITADELYEGLLGYGMFGDKLPPVFTSVSFLNYCKMNSPSYKLKEWHDYVQFSSMRNINIPRLFGIPTPMKHQVLCAELRDNWDTIKQHFHTQTDGQNHRISRIHIRKEYGADTLFRMNYKNWRVDGNPEIDLLFLDSNNNAASQFVVRADISTCFSSIYSHSLSWALVGKANAKKNRNKNDFWYNRIDTACSSMRNGETHGLLIGPHTSNLLSEIILTTVDKKLYDADYKFVRYIDDYECYVENEGAAQRFLRDLEEALREFDLPLNHKKTVVKRLPVAFTERWIHKLNGLLVSFGEEIKYNEVNAYLDLAIRLAYEEDNSAVLNYAIKALARQKIKTSAKLLATQRLMHLAVIYPYLLQVMDNYVFQPMDVDVARIKSFADTIYKGGCDVNNYEAVSFSIFYSLKYGFELENLDIEWVINRGDCIMLLLTWLYYLKVYHGYSKATLLKQLKEEALRLKDSELDRYWLFCFEVLSTEDLTGDWQKMKQAGVSFVKRVL